MTRRTTCLLVQILLVAPLAARAEGLKACFWSPSAEIAASVPALVASREFTEAEIIEQQQFEEANRYYDWIGDEKYVRVGPPSLRQNCVGYLLERGFGVNRQVKIGGGDFYDLVVRAYGSRIFDFAQARSGDVVVYAGSKEGQAHVALVESSTPLVILTKDEDESVFRHWPEASSPWSIGEWTNPDPLRSKHGSLRIFRFPDDLEIDVVDADKPCPGEVPELDGLTRVAAETVVRDAELEPDGEVGEEQPPREEDRGRVYHQSPRAGSHQERGTVVSFTLYPSEEGFQAGDGALVSPKFRGAEVSDGSFASIAPEPKPSSGEDTAIHYSTNPTYQNLQPYRNPLTMWSVKRFNSRAELDAELQPVRESWAQVESVSNPQSSFTVRERRLDRNDLLLRSAINTTTEVGRRAYASYQRFIVHRDVFLISYYQTIPDPSAQPGQDSEQVLAKSRELVDLRFPPVD